MEIKLSSGDKEKTIKLDGAYEEFGHYYTH